MKISHRTIQLLLLGANSLMFLFGGVAILWAAIDFYSEGQQSKNWPSTNGVITQSRVNVFGTSDGKEYKADIEYRFKVGEQTHTSDRVNLGYKTSTKLNGIAHTLVDNYYTRRKVQVFYDPNDPSSSLLENGIHWTTYLSFAGGPLVFFLGIFFGRWVLMELRQPGSVLSR